ncbi:MAG: methyltransferase domain-containing protein [Thermoanaerobaculia bacterium]
MLTPERVDTEELLDEHDAPRTEMERSLRDLRRINRWLGGVSIYRRLLERAAPLRSVVDVGAGTADQVGSVDVPMRIALDFKFDHLTYLRDAPVHRVVGDARHLPFRDDSIDAVTSAHFFHHFSPEENVVILREALRVARKAVVINDTRRHYAPLLFIRLVSALRLVGRITRYDGPASVRRGYTIDEARAIAQRTGAGRAEVRRAFPFRFGLLLWKQST